MVNQLCNKDSDICVICFEILQGENENNNEPLITLYECNHIMHTKCFMKYAQYTIQENKKALCPICRNIIIEISDSSDSQQYTIQTNNNSDMHDSYISIKTQQIKYIVIFIAGTILLSYGLMDMMYKQK